MSAGSIYPVKDGYRDTVTLSGNRDESIAVTISIYNSNNKRVRLATKSSATGAYSYVWNGRDSKGAVLPAGKYRVVQRLVDEFGTAKSFTSSVNLSPKKLVTQSKVVTKNGSAHQPPSSATLRRPARHAAGQGGVRWRRWRRLAVQDPVRRDLQVDLVPHQRGRALLGAAVRDRHPELQHLHGSWSTSCFDRWKGIGNSSGARKWYTTSGSPSSHRKGNVVGIVYVPQGTVFVYKAEVKVTYQILK